MLFLKKNKSLYLGSELKIFYFFNGSLMPFIGTCINIKRGILTLYAIKGGYAVNLVISIKNIAYISIIMQYSKLTKLRKRGYFLIK